jgi:hypothetical protein
MVIIQTTGLQRLLQDTHWLPPPDGEAISIDRSVIERDLWAAIRRVRDNLNAAYSRLAPYERASPFELIVSGWRKRKRSHRWVPILIEIAKERGQNTEFQIIHRAENWDDLIDINYAVNPRNSYLNQKEIADMQQRIADQSNSTTDWRENALASRSVFVDIIRRAGARFRAVGPHCMCVILPLPHSAPIEVEYIPREPTFTRVQTKVSQQIMPIGYSPWIVVSDGGHFPPTAIGGGLSPRLHFGGHDIQIKGSSVPSTASEQSGPQLTGFVSSQRRPPKP